MFGKKKASTYLVILFVIIAVIVLYMLKTQIETTSITANEQTTEQAHREYLGNYYELIKRYSTDALRSSTTRATISSASNGGGKNPWRISSCPAPPLIPEVKSNVLGFSADNFQGYMENLENHDFGKLKINKMTTGLNMEINVTPVNIANNFESFLIRGRSFNGKNEIVNFKDNERRSSYHSYTTTVNPNRFWYLYYTIFNWVMMNQIPSGICQSMDIVQLNTAQDCDATCKSIIQGAPTPNIEAIIANAVNYLSNTMFDHYVDCTYEITCQSKNKNILNNQKTCEFGCKVNADQNNMNGCKWTMTTNPCTSSAGIACPAGSASCSFPYNGWLPSSGCVYECHEDEICRSYGVKQRAEASYKITCVDKKYEIPGPGTMQNLVFEINENVVLDHQVNPPDIECQPEPECGNGICHCLEDDVTCKDDCS